MKKISHIVSFLVVFGLSTLGSAWAGPDDYVGDTAIFGGAGPGLPPNVLLIVDTSGSMREIITREAYDPNVTYADSQTCESSGQKPCIRDYIYECDERDYLNCSRWKKGHADLNKLSSGCNVVIDELRKNGLFATNKYIIDLNRNSCSQTRDDRTFRYYATGNWINFRRQAQDASKLDVAKKVVKDLITANPGIRFGLMRFNFEDGGRFATSGTYTAYVENLDEIWSGTTKKRTKFLEAVDGLTAEGWTPLAETLFEARAYFRGLKSPFNSGVNYVSPVQSHCQNNYIILISDGMSTRDDHALLRTLCNNGDCDGDGFEPAKDPRKTYPNSGSDYLDDVAWELYHSDIFPQWTGKQNVVTYTVGFGLEGGVESAVLLLDETMQNGTGGRRTEAFLANDPVGLASALTSIIDEIREVHTSFATPMAPASPQNRYASGERIYLGMFQPMSDGRWRGNLKKYGLAKDGKILDAKEEVATSVAGGILEKAQSYWSSAADGPEVNKGGAGAMLLSRDFSNNPRRIYTNISNKPDLSDGDNRFALGNAGLSAALLGVTVAERGKLIPFVHGIDAYDDNANNNTSEKRAWILGDILHSSPVVVHYNNYKADQESDPTLNKSVIFVGANDGQLHAFRDADGEELWSFIPDILLPDLKYLRDGSHSYFVDMTPTVFIFDKNQNGIIEAGDRVLLMFGLRRGGGKDRLLADQVRGGYYALDVTDPEKPQFLWKITSATSGFGELGEAWSPPVSVRMKVQEGGTVKDLMVAVFGAGYDNNEDRRFGNTQGFPATTTDTDTTLATLDAGKVTSPSPANGAQLNPRGRGLYAVKLGEFSAGTFTPATSPGKLWGFTVANNAAMSFSFPAEIAALDLSHNGYVDRFYAADTGGQLWRIDAHHPDPKEWTVARIFAANDGPGTQKGRKFLQRPSVTVERNRQPLIFLGSGDREHPLNEAVVDRFYAIKDPVDRPASKTAWNAQALLESDLVDVTDNVLQAASLTAQMQTDLGVSTLDEAVQKVLKDLQDKDGWFIKLDLRDGEKILSPGLVFNKVAYFTTFTPEIQVNEDPCQTSNPGVARLYAVDYLTGEAVKNYDLTNDGQGTETNLRAKGRDGKVLRRSDRERTLGSGIPSGVSVVISETGEPKILIGCDGGICVEDALPGGRVQPLYWLQR